MSDSTFLQLNSTGWTAVTGLATGALVVAGVITALAAFRQLQSSRTTWRDERRAYVWVDLQSNPTHPFVMEFVICNSGGTSARDVKLVWDRRPEPALPNQASFADTRMFTEGIPLLTPGRAIRTMFDSTLERYKDGIDLPSAYTVTVAYTDTFGTRHEEKYLLDVDTLKGTSYVGVKGVHHAAKALEEIQRVVVKSGIGKREGLRVTTQTATDAAAWDRERLALVIAMNSPLSAAQIIRARRPKRRNRAG